MNEHLQGPDFLIVGAPKCGTTALADVLAQHPEVGMCAVKETHYFAGEAYWGPFGAFRGDRPPTSAEYESLFAGTSGARRRGEASVWYLWSPSAAETIRASVPEAGIVVMLRNPWEMLPSLHSQLVFIGIEPERDLARALALDEGRGRGGAPPGFPSRSYRSAAAYAEQLRRYLRVFGPDRVHVILHERFRADPVPVYASLCRFLGIDAGFVPDVRVVNPNTVARSRTLNRVLIRPPPALRRLGSLAPARGGARITGRMSAWNTRVAAREPPGPPIAEVLRPLVSEQVSELRELLGIDLRGWLAALDAAG